MADLLPDNLGLARCSRRRSSAVHLALQSLQTTRNFLKTGKDWSLGQCFMTFIAVIASKHPDKSQELLAYHATVLIEALRFGCKGWLSYDKMFRENIEKEPHSTWTMLHPMFYSLTFLSRHAHLSEMYGTGPP